MSVVDKRQLSLLDTMARLGIINKVMRQVLWSPSMNNGEGGEVWVIVQR